MVLVVASTIGYITVLRPSSCHQRTSIVTTPANADGQSTFPSVAAQTLAGRCVAFPEATNGKVGLVFVAFERNAQYQIDTWVAPLIEEYLASPDVAYYEIPMISGAYKLAGRFIDAGMRGGVPNSLHDRTATFYGNRSPFTKAMNISDMSKAYLFVLDRDGRIVFRTQGSADPDQVSATRTAIEALLAS
jgi:hypothetical protein